MGSKVKSSALAIRSWGNCMASSLIECMLSLHTSACDISITSICSKWSLSMHTRPPSSSLMASCLTGRHCLLYWGSSLLSSTLQEQTWLIMKVYMPLLDLFKHLGCKVCRMPSRSIWLACLLWKLYQVKCLSSVSRLSWYWLASVILSWSLLTAMSNRSVCGSRILCNHASRRLISLWAQLT